MLIADPAIRDTGKKAPRENSQREMRREAHNTKLRLRKNSSEERMQPRARNRLTYWTSLEPHLIIGTNTETAGKSGKEFNMARKTSVLFYVSNEFRDAAKASPMSYADMARVIEMDERNLRNYLTGTLVFSLGVKPRLEKLAHVIGVPIADAVSQCAEDHLYDQPSTTDPLFVHNRKDGKLPRAK